MPAFTVISGIVALIAFMSGISVYGVGKSAIHEIYAAVLLLISAVSILTMTVSIAADKILHQLQILRELQTLPRV